MRKIILSEKEKNQTSVVIYEPGNINRTSKRLNYFLSQLNFIPRHNSIVIANVKVEGKSYPPQNFILEFKDGSRQSLKEIETEGFTDLYNELSQVFIEVE